jgi:MFS family permease
LIALAAVFACGAMVEGGIDTWGVLVLRDRLGTTVLVGAGAYLAGQAVATTVRATLGPAAGSAGAARGIGLGGGLATVGLALVALAPSWGAALGLAMAAAGIAVCWPLLLAQAGAGRERPAAVVGGVSAVGYLGFVVGPPVVGLLAGVVGLRPALLVLAVAAAVVAVAPSRLAGRRRPGPVLPAAAGGPATPAPH